MLKFDRAILIVLAFGIWVLVLSPQEIGAQEGHSCNIIGKAYVELHPVFIDPVAVHKVEVDISGLSINCSHG